jgi:hypothetical protein
MSRGGRVRTATLVATAVLAMPAPAAAQAPNLPWTELLPALPTPTDVQPGPVPRCRRPTLRCIDATIAVMRRVRDQLGCDHRGVFATTYLVLTQVIRETLRARPNFFRFRSYFIWEDVLFANYYFDVLRRAAQRRSVPEAWRIAFDTAARGDANAAQDMLLGINAHVQRDMPYVLEELGLRTRRGESRKVDHDRMNAVLNRAYERVVREVRRRYDPVIEFTNSSAHPVDDVVGLETVRTWREGVWRNAERLVSARSPAQRAQVAQSIEANAAGWARSIAAVQVPGYRAQRDAYCAARAR